MNRYLPAWLIGSLSFVAFVVNTAVHFPFLLSAALLRTLVPLPAIVRACRRAAHGIAASWIGCNVLGLKAGGRIQWHVVEPAGLSVDAWYMVTCNHRSWVDIVVVQWLFNRRIPMLKFFLKKELFWVPGLGLAWWALEFPFMKRYPRAVLEKRPELRGADLETTRKACQRFRELPVSVLNFLEGTRFSRAKRDRQQSPYAHLLLPRAGGVAQVVSSLGDQLRSWLDVTIVYPDGTPTFWDLISGRIRRISVHVDEVPLDASWFGRDYDGDAGFRESFQAFVRELWERKDARIAVMLPAGVD
jgi:1-acyl-sn-glycerol-3-phosphate acyltransferase